MIATRPGAQLALATWVSVVNFWAWNLVGPLAITDAALMSLDSSRESVLVATPVLVGSFGRIVIGPLTDRFGSRIMFVGVSLAAIGPVLGIGAAEVTEHYLLALICALLLGVSGTVFAVGIPFATNWYEPARRGFATGVFGMGMVGTAVSAFCTPRFARRIGLMNTHLVIAAALAGTAALCILLMRNGPHFRPNTDPVLPKLKAAARLRITWQMSVLYVVVFGGFIAFSNYLPTYIRAVYGFSSIDAGSRTAAFALAAVLARPVGGALADRMPAKHLVVAALAGVAMASSIAIVKPPPDLWSAATFISLAIALGIGTGAVFAWVAHRTPAGSLGTVTGIVSAIGGLGGCLPPLVMGATYDPVHDDYTDGLLLVVAAALVALAYAVLRLPSHESVRAGDAG